MLPCRRAEKQNRILILVSDRPQISLSDLRWPQRAVGNHFGNCCSIALQRRRQVGIRTITSRQEYLRPFKPFPQLLSKCRSRVRLRNELHRKSHVARNLTGYRTNNIDLQLVASWNKSSLHRFSALHHSTDHLPTPKDDPVPLLAFPPRSI